MTLRRAVLALHRYIALGSALFLAAAGLSGAVIALGPEIERVFDSALWTGASSATRLPEETLLGVVESRFGGDRVEMIDLAGPGGLQSFGLVSGCRVFVDPGSGSIRTVHHGPSRTESALLWTREIHVRLLAGPAGAWTVDIATLLLLPLTATGLILWWRTKRWRFDRRTRRLMWDLHNLAGLYSSVLLIALGATGALMAFDGAIDWMTRGAVWRTPPLPHSAVPEAVRRRLDLDALMAAADAALPGEETYLIRLPSNPRSPVEFAKHAAGGPSAVFLDQYSGAVLRLDDFRRLPAGYRAHEIVRAIHTGEIFGTASRLVTAMSSLALVLLSATGVTLWWRRFASSTPAT